MNFEVPSGPDTNSLHRPLMTSAITATRASSGRAFLAQEGKSVNNFAQRKCFDSSGSVKTATQHLDHGGLVYGRRQPLEGVSRSSRLSTKHRKHVGTQQCTVSVHFQLLLFQIKQS